MKKVGYDYLTHLTRANPTMGQLREFIKFFSEEIRASTSSQVV